MDIATDPIVLTPIAGAAFAWVAAIARRRYGPRALWWGTATCVALTAFVLSRTFVLVALFIAPAVPSVLAAAGMLEWRARRRPRDPLWRDVAWGAAAFVLTLVAVYVVVQFAFRGTRLP